jgi:hypothetical protein
LREGAMRALFILSLIILSSPVCLTQEKIESDIDYAFQNAKKGIYWALANIPEKKSKLESELIADDKLYANVKLRKEVNGIKIESTGYYNSNEVSIYIYRSNDSLEQDGYLETGPEEKKEN